MADKKPLANYSGRIREIVSTDVVDGNLLPAISTTKRAGVPAAPTPTGQFLKDDDTWDTPAGGVTQAEVIMWAIVFGG